MIIAAMVAFTTFSSATPLIATDRDDGTIRDTECRMAPATYTAQQLINIKAEAFLWLSRHPGKDAEDLAEHMGISLAEASNTIESLLNEGLLDFAD